MSVYGNQRIGKRANNEYLKFFLAKFREDFIKAENSKRAELKSKELRK